MGPSSSHTLLVLSCVNTSRILRDIYKSLSVHRISKRALCSKSNQVTQLEAQNIHNTMASQTSTAALVIVLLSAGCILAQHPRIPIAPCNGNNAMTGKLLEVRVSNCNNNFPCILKRGSQATIEFDYIPAQDTNRITTGATARLGAVPLPFVGTNNQPACSRITSKQSRQNTGCQLKAGEVYTYSNTFPILQIYPTTSVMVQWELVDSNRQKITCFTIPARIV